MRLFHDLLRPGTRRAVDVEREAKQVDGHAAGKTKAVTVMLLAGSTEQAHDLRSLVCDEAALVQMTTMQIATSALTGEEGPRARHVLFHAANLRLSDKANCQMAVKSNVVIFSDQASPELVLAMLNTYREKEIPADNWPVVIVARPSERGACDEMQSTVDAMKAAYVEAGVAATAVPLLVQYKAIDPAKGRVVDVLHSQFTAAKLLKEEAASMAVGAAMRR